MPAVIKHLLGNYEHALESVRGSINDLWKAAL